jgi:hypothetical protein
LTRSDCSAGGFKHVRPCPIPCRHRIDVVHNDAHVYPDDREPHESCALDVADRGPHALHEIGAIIGVTRERIRQIEAIALRKLKRAAKKHDFDLGDLLPVRRSAMEELSMGERVHLSSRECDEINQKCDEYMKRRVK